MKMKWEISLSFLASIIMARYNHTKGIEKNLNQKFFFNVQDLHHQTVPYQLPYLDLRLPHCRRDLKLLGKKEKINSCN